MTINMNGGNMCDLYNNSRQFYGFLINQFLAAINKPSFQVDIRALVVRPCANQHRGQHAGR
jgi:hypothetical protein